MDEFEGEISKIRDETHDVKTFRVKAPKDFSFIPGQFCLIGICDSIDCKGLYKPFTFSNSPTDKEFIELTVKEMGKFTKELFTLKIGDKLIIRGPKGEKLNFDENVKEDVVFLAGGSGITPFLSALRYAHTKKLPNEIHLFFSNRTKKDVICLDELNSISGDQIKIINTLTNEEPEGWDGEHGYVDESMIRRYIKDPVSKLWYICGPPGMTEAMRKLLKGIGVKEENIRIEPWEMKGKHEG